MIDSTFATTKADVLKKYVAFCEEIDPYDIDLTQGSPDWYQVVKLFNENPYEIISQLLDTIDELQC